MPRSPAVYERGILTTYDAARFTGTSIPTIRKMCDNGTIASHTVPGGKEKRISAPDLIKFMIKNKIPIPKELKELKRKYEAEFGTDEEKTEEE